VSEAAPRSALAVDIGGSGMRAARVNANGTVGRTERRPLLAGLDAAEILSRLRHALAALGAGPLEVGLGISAPGYVNEEGRIRFCVNLPALNGLDLSVLLADVLPGRPVTVVPDLAATALAEALLGAGRGVPRFLCTALGTGVNAAMTVHGELLVTVAGCLGEAGHVLVDPDGPRCSCGGSGCLEAVASGVALAREGSAHGFDDARSLVQAARDGHGIATAIVERAGVALGRAIATWCTMLWPDRVAVGGGVAGAGELLLGPARRELRRVCVPYLTHAVELVPAHLGREAALIGAGLFALGAGRHGATRPGPRG
jgi:glucokinase